MHQGERDRELRAIDRHRLSRPMLSEAKAAELRRRVHAGERVTGPRGEIPANI